MTKEIAGSGNKRPLLDIPVLKLDLDNENPRLAQEHQGADQSTILRTLIEEFDVEELAYSMAENGYFDEEPIVVVPETLPKEYRADKFDNVDEYQAALKQFVAKKDTRFVVVEGNRRTAAAKLLIDEHLRKKLSLRDDFPVPRSELVKDDLRIIPAIFYETRKDISAYLGVRHIIGISKWEAYARAVFIARRIEEGLKKKDDIDKRIDEIRRQIGDRADVIRKQYMCYKLVEQAEEDIGFDTEEIKRRFSLITVALNQRAIRDYIGVVTYKEVDFTKSLVPAKKLVALQQVLTWIFGDKPKGKQAILTDSRQITSTLSPVLADKEATAHLIRYENLQDAYERSGGDKTYLIKKLSSVKRGLSVALGLAYKFRNENEVRDLIEECASAFHELEDMIKKKR
jgi:hypothetical protein